MRYLHIKLLRDLRQNWQQFFSVFLMSLLSVLIFVGLQGAWHGLEKSLESYLKQSELPVVWVQARQIDESKIKQVELLSSVEKVVSKKKGFANIVRLDKTDGRINLETITDNQLVTVTEGSPFSEGKQNSIWVDGNYAKKNHLQIGDSISISSRGKQIDLEIVGFVQATDKIYFTGSMEYIAPNPDNDAYGYIADNEIAKGILGLSSDNALEIYGSKVDLRGDLESILGSDLVSYQDQKSLTEISEATDRVGQIRNLSYLFSFIFILLAILAMFTTIQRLIDGQTKEIAVLKALGFSNQAISLHYILFGLVVSLLGSFAGFAISPLMSWFVLETQKSMFTLPNWQISYSSSSIVVGIVVIIICVLAAYLASRESARGLPAIFLRGKEKVAKSVFVERFSSIWQRISYPSRWAIRDASFNRIRVLMGIVGVAGSMMLLIAGIGMPVSMNHLVDKAYNEDFSYSKRLTVADYPTSKSKYGGQGVQISQAHFSPDDGYNRLLIIFDDGDMIQAKTESAESLKDDGLYVTRSFARLAGIKVGDFLTVTPYQDGHTYKFEVKGIVTSETNQGAYLHARVFEKAGGDFTPHTLLVGSEVDEDTIKQDKGVLSVIEKGSQEKNAYDFVASLMSVFLMIIGFALLLVIIVLYNLGSLNFVERMRDYATLQVLGFSNQYLQMVTLFETVLTTFIGWLVGIPLGVWFLKEYVATFSTIRIEYTAYVSMYVLAFATLLVWFTSLGTAYFISLRMRKIDMISALKGVD